MLATGVRYRDAIGRPARILLIVGVVAMVFAPGLVRAGAATSGGEMAAAVLAPTSADDEAVTSTKARAADLGGPLLAVVPALLVLAAGRRLRWGMAPAPPGPGAVAEGWLRPPRRGPPPAAG